MKTKPGGDSMKIEKISDSRIKLTISREDMDSFGINVNSILTDAPQMKHFFQSLMKKAEKETGFCAENSRLMIEAHSHEAGGVILFVTNLDKTKTAAPTRKIRAKAKEEITNGISVFEFASFEDICNFVKNCYGGYRGGALYAYKDKYYLSSFRNIHPLVFEYVKNIYEEPLFEAMLREHGKCIIEENAINTIDKYFN